MCIPATSRSSSTGSQAGGLPALPGAAAVGRRVRVPALRHGRRRLVADGRRLAPLRGLSVGDLGDGGHDLRRHPYPLVSWFAAVWYVVNQKNGVSALGLQRVLGLGSYQTAWAWLHKLRRAMVRPGRDALEGIVEVDETLIGGVKTRQTRPWRRRQGARRGRRRGLRERPGTRADAPHPRRIGRHPDRVRTRLTSPAAPRSTPTRGAATTTSAATASSTSSRTSPPPATPRTWSCPRSTASPACSSAGCSAPTKARSPTTSSTTTWTSSPSASTAADRAIAACCSTASSKAPSPQPRSHTESSSPASGQRANGRNGVTG